METVVKNLNYYQDFILKFKGLRMKIIYLLLLCGIRKLHWQEYATEKFFLLK